MNGATLVLVLCGVLLNAAAQLLLKAGVRPLGAIGVDIATIVPAVGRALLQGPVLLGLASYVVSVVVWLVALSRVEVSLAYPMLSLGYVVNAVAAYWLFGEALGPLRCVGIALILAGVFVLARS